MTRNIGNSRTRNEAILMDIRDGSSKTSGWEPRSRNEALLMDIRDKEDGGSGGSTPVATSETAGIVKPDGTTIAVDENGVISLAIENADSTEY